jgi:hypothetical protein
VIFEALENALVQKVQDLITVDTLGFLLDPHRCKTIIDRMDRRRKNKIDLGWTSLLNFGEIIAFARYFGFLDLSDEHIYVFVTDTNKSTVCTHNSVAHQVKLTKLSSILWS